MYSRTRDSAVGQDMYIAHSRTQDSGTCTYHTVGHGTVGHVHITVGHGTVQLGRTCT